MLNNINDQFFYFEEERKSKPSYHLGMLGTTIHEDNYDKLEKWKIGEIKSFEDEEDLIDYLIKQSINKFSILDEDCNIKIWTGVSFKYEDTYKCTQKIYDNFIDEYNNLNMFIKHGCKYKRGVVNAPSLNEIKNY